MYLPSQRKISLNLITKLRLSNRHQVPHFKSIKLHMGLNDSIYIKSKFLMLFYVFTLITGFKPKITKAVNSIASLNIRKNQEVGFYFTFNGKYRDIFLLRLLTGLSTTQIPLFNFERLLSSKKDSITVSFNDLSLFNELESSNLNLKDVLSKIGYSIEFKQNTNNKLHFLHLIDHLGFPVK